MAPKPDTLMPNDGGLQLPNSPKSSLQTLASRSRSPGHGRIRKPAVEWNNADEIDDGQDEPLEASDDDGQDLAKLGEEVEKKSPSGGRIIDLLDIARPAKPKGVAKEFEVVQGSPRIVTLPDEPIGPEVREEDWEDIDSEIMDSRKSYSAIVRESD